MPLSGNERAVANGPKNLPEGCSVLHMIVPNRVRVVAGEKFGPCGVALCGVVELGEAQTVLGELVEIGGLDLSSVTSDIRVAHVIHHNEDKVWTGVVGSGVCEEGAEHESGEE